MMLTIAGSGMSDYSIQEIAEKLDWNEYERIYLDNNYLNNQENGQYLSGDSGKLFAGGFVEIRDEIVSALSKDRNINLLYIVTGSPTFYSGGTILLDQLEKKLSDFDRRVDAKIIPNKSCKDHLVEGLAIPEQDIAVLSLHGRSAVQLSDLLIKKYTLVLADDETLNKIKEILHYLDSKSYNLLLASKLGYPDEEIIPIQLDEYSGEEIDVNSYKPYVLLIERLFTPPRAISTENEFAQDDGMITKSLKRHFALSELNLSPNLLLWDIGAGSGSVGIDAYKSYKVRTVFFEKNPKRAKDIIVNLNQHKVIGCRLMEGDFSPLVKKELDKPDRIFVGGGGMSSAIEMPYFYDALKSGGIIVANYVVIDHLAKAIEMLKNANIAFTLKNISLTTYKSKGILLPEPERLMFQIKITKE